MSDENRGTMPTVYTTMKELTDFIIYYERRHADLEQRIAVQSTEQNARYDNIQRDMASLKGALDEIKSILKNGLISQVAALVRERDKSERRREDFLITMVKDWVRVIIIVAIVAVVENAHTFFSILGVR